MVGLGIVGSTRTIVNRKNGQKVSGFEVNLLQDFQRALITGGSSGIGLAIVEALAAQDLETIILSNSREDLDREETRLRGLGRKVQGLYLELDHKESVCGLWSRLEEQYGPIDLLVNNAGIGYHATLQESDLEKIRQVFEVNFFAPMALCQQALGAMGGRKRGHIVNISSASARRGLANMSGYASSKGALHVFTQTLRLEAAALGVRVSEVLPISVATPFFARSETARGLGYRPKGVVQTPEHVAQAVLACLRGNIPELCTHSPTAWGFVLDSLAPNWVARILGWWDRRS